jgi:hypothetical protein
MNESSDMSPIAPDRESADERAIRTAGWEIFRDANMITTDSAQQS